MKKLSLLIAMMLAPVASFALPTGETVSSGTVAIDQSVAGTTTYNQTSNSAIVNVTGFNIGAGESVLINQPSVTSSILFRVNSTSAPSIDGSLTANGNVFISSPAGIYISNGAQIVSNNFIASSMNITDSDFMAGNYRFYKRSVDTPADVMNDGTITANNVALISTQEANNHGYIFATSNAALVGGNEVTVDLLGNGMMTVQTTKAALAATATNTGFISADTQIMKVDAVDWAINMIGLNNANTIVMSKNGISLTYVADNRLYSGVDDVTPSDYADPALPPVIVSGPSSATVPGSVINDKGEEMLFGRDVPYIAPTPAIVDSCVTKLSDQINFESFLKNNQDPNYDTKMAVTGMSRAEMWQCCPAVNTYSRLASKKVGTKEIEKARNACDALHGINQKVGV